MPDATSPATSGALDAASEHVRSSFWNGGKPLAARYSFDIENNFSASNPPEVARDCGAADGGVVGDSVGFSVGSGVGVLVGVAVGAVVGVIVGRVFGSTRLAAKIVGVGSRGGVAVGCSIDGAVALV